ncbi:MAG: hypothetical protein JRN20_13940 [Nitrososphaerota archaeon]|nr:hypothetical protein [Nitrososphaerota archaeon]MDG6922726.1 hypothetical protein [Nitrososphaerota archaeon]
MNRPVTAILVIALMVTVASITTVAYMQLKTGTASDKGQPTTSLLTSTTFSSSQTAQNSQEYNSNFDNLTKFILLNNIVQSQSAYRVFDTSYIESWSNETATGIMLWSFNHTTSITITSNTMYVQPHYNCGIMRTFGTVIQWPVYSIYNMTNIPYPVTVYIGSSEYDPSNYAVANTTSNVLVQNYFIVGYVSDGLPFIIYSSYVNATNVRVQVDNNPPCSGNQG